MSPRRGRPPILAEAGTIASRLQRMRMDRGWTQEAVACDLGVSQRRVQEIEHAADDSYRLGTLRRMATLYGVSLADLVDGR